MNFLSHFYYVEEGLGFFVTSEGTAENYSFHDTAPESWPTDTDVWFAPAVRALKGNFKEDVLGTKFLWVDVDDENGIAQSTLPASFIVRSGGGCHVYFGLNEPCEDVETIERLNKLLAQDIPHADLSCWNVNRILRVPGTLNTKPEYGEPRRVTLEIERPNLTYSLDDFKILETLNDKVRHKIRTGDKRGHRTRSERDWSIIVALVRAGASDDLIYKIFENQPCGDKARKEPTYFQHTLERAREEHEPTKVTDKESDSGPTIIEGPDGLYHRGRGLKRITTFTLDPVLLLDGSDFDIEDALVCNVAAEGHNWTNVTFAKSAFNSVTQMDKHTKLAAWQFLGNESHLRPILPYLMEKLQTKGLPRVKATSVLGLHKIKDEWLFLGDKQTMSAAELWNGFDGPLAWLPVQREHPSMCLEWNAEHVPYYQETMKLIPRLNEPEVIWPMIGWYTMASLKPVVEACNFRFPILNVAGTRGSGKTTLILRVFMPMFGQKDPKSYDAGTTKFVTLSLLGSSNAVPVAFSEFRFDSVANFIRYILLAYDTGHDPRGRADQTTVDYPLSSPFTVDGEDMVDDPAGKERMVVTVLHPNAVREDTDCYKALGEYWNHNTHSPGPWIIQNLLRKAPQLKELLDLSFSEMFEVYPSHLPDRVRRNYAVAWTGVKLWCELAEMDTPSLSVFHGSIDNIYSTTLGRARVLADSMIEDITNAAIGGSQSFKYAVREEGSEFWFQLASAHNYWSSSRRRQGRGALERDAIRNQVKESPYFIGTQAIEDVWMYGIDLRKAFDLGLDLPSKLNERRMTINF